MSERKLSPLQLEYKKFFLNMLSDFNTQSPARLSNEEKSKFFTRIKVEWTPHKEAFIDQWQTSIKSNLKQIKKTTSDYKGQESKEKILIKKTIKKEQKSASINSEVQVIESQPNPEQTKELKIGFQPTNFFKQENTPKFYPIVEMPKSNAPLKLPRKGRSNNKGYLEDSFEEELREKINNFEIDTNCHLTIPNFNRPYEPDFLLFSKSKNLYINIEIDEPYDGYLRNPTHYKDEEHYLQGKDRIRDLFFIESGWVVIRFSERQIKLEAKHCIQFINIVIDSVVTQTIPKIGFELKEPLWLYKQSVKWEKEKYREEYLGIASFKKVKEKRKILVKQEDEEIDIHRSQLIDINVLDKEAEIGFEPKLHIYTHPKDLTGSAEYLSVSSLLEKIFIFDIERYLERKSEQEGKPIDQLRSEHELKRIEAAEKGTELHLTIENYLLKNYENVNQTLPEYSMFKTYYENEILANGLEFVEAEKKIFTTEFNIAGTVDAIFKKKNKNEYVVFDWKRSEKIVIDDGEPDRIGYPLSVKEFLHFNNCSYYRYLIQQSLYKYILEKYYSMKISSINLLVLHKKYSKAFRLKLIPAISEVKNILKLINTKR